MPRDRARSEEIISYLRQRGASPARDIAAWLGVSQPTASRALASAYPQVIPLGAARRARYAAPRDVRGLGSAWPLHRIDAQGRPHTLGTLTALQRDEMLLSAGPLPDWLRDDFVDGLFPGLPWFIDDQRPQGFLGRQFARRFSRQLGMPDDVLRWSHDDVLAALLLQGPDGPGNFVLGDAALERALSAAPSMIDAGERAEHYATMAEAALAGDVVGSSAAGEQPKFTACVRDADGTARHVIVKFSEPVDTPPARRWADLLIAEHLASVTLAVHGHDSARSAVIWSQGRLCLEVTRFDRVGEHGRRGIVSLAAWSDAHDGQRDDWAAATSRMQHARWIDAVAQREARRRWLFGRLIANTDMHFGNLAFFLDDALPLTLAPSYDMLPMMYRPGTTGAIVPRDYQPPAPVPAQFEDWSLVTAWATDFWTRVSACDDISESFRQLAAENHDTLQALRTRFL